MQFRRCSLLPQRYRVRGRVWLSRRRGCIRAQHVGVNTQRDTIIANLVPLFCHFERGASVSELSRSNFPIRFRSSCRISDAVISSRRGGGSLYHHFGPRRFLRITVLSRVFPRITLDSPVFSRTLNSDSLHFDQYHFVLNFQFGPILAISARYNLFSMTSFFLKTRIIQLLSSGSLSIGFLFQRQNEPLIRNGENWKKPLKIGNLSWNIVVTTVPENFADNQRPQSWLFRLLFGPGTIMNTAEIVTVTSLDGRLIYTTIVDSETVTLTRLFCNTIVNNES